MNNRGVEVLIRHRVTDRLNSSENPSHDHGCDEEYMPSNYSCHLIPDVAILVVYIFIVLCNFIGNGIVVSIILLKRRMQTFTNFMLLNLCIADLAIGLFCMTMEIPMEIHPHKWIYGKMFCHFLYPIQTAAVYASVLTLVVLSCSRYLAIVHPYAAQPTACHARVIIFFIWLLSFSFVIPYMLGLELNEGSEHCEEVWNESERRVFTSLTFICQYGIPISLISVAYSFIVYELNFKIQPKTSRREEEIKRKENKKLVKLLVIITTTFALCVLPYHTVALWVEFGNGVSFEYIEDLSVVTFFILYMNSALDPILYNVFSTIFRKEFRNRWKSIQASFSAKPTVIKMQSLKRISTTRTLIEEELCADQ